MPITEEYPHQLFPHGRWLVCRPTFFDVRYEINPWMSIQRGPHKGEALREWRLFHHSLLRLGAWLHYIEPISSQPDLVFTANAGLVVNDKFILSRFHHKERQGESPIFRKWFEEHKFNIIELSQGTFEGEGDALFVDKVLFGGFGFRTDKQALDELATILHPIKIVLCELVDPYFYHLDTCFCPLDGERALYYPGALHPESIKQMKKHVELFPVSEKNARAFACNSVVLGKSILIPSDCADTMHILHGLGFTCYETPLYQFMKAGGAAKCLSLRLDRKLAD